jgi:hypothetical protein
LILDVFGRAQIYQKIRGSRLFFAKAQLSMVVFNNEENPEKE